jgi:hypothetical protein
LLVAEKCNIILIPEYCNEKGTVTKKAFKIEGFIKQSLKPAITHKVALRYLQINKIFIRCGSLFGASYFECKI